MKRLVLLLTSLLLAMPAGAAKDRFHLYNWNNYLAPETVKRFEELGITPVKASSAEFADLVAKQANDWAPIIKAADLK